MSTQHRPATPSVEELIKAITKKLRAHESVLEKSRHGRLSWRIANGEIEIELEARL